MGLVASMVLRCDDCIRYHLVRCVQEGLSDEEIFEAFDVALVVGGSIVIPHLRRAVDFLEELRGCRKMARLFLFDGTALAYRAYYALDRSLSTSTGIPTNAVYGVARMLVKFIKEHIIPEKDYAAVAFDKKAATFRHKLLEAYKAQRPKTPDLLVQQLPYIKRLIEALGFKVLELEGYEADDIIATLAVKGCTFLMRFS